MCSLMSFPAAGDGKTLPELCGTLLSKEGWHPPHTWHSTSLAPHTHSCQSAPFLKGMPLFKGFLTKSHKFAPFLPLFLSWTPFFCRICPNQRKNPLAVPLQPPLSLSSCLCLLGGLHKKTHFHGHQNWPLKLLGGLQGVSLCRQEFPDHMDDEHLVDFFTLVLERRKRLEISAGYGGFKIRAK